MRILLCYPLLSEGTTGHLALKALGNLNQDIVVWDYRVANKPPDVEYDLAIVWNNIHLNPTILDMPKALVFLDDPTYPTKKTFKLLNKVTPYYDYFFHVNYFNWAVGYWLPLGCDAEVHRKYILTPEEERYYGSDITFIGTLRDKERLRFFANLSYEIKDKLPDKTLKIWGNGWPHVKLPNTVIMHRPIYFVEFAKVCTASKIVINQHFNTAPSTKDFEISACTFMISDNKDGITKIYKRSIKTYNDEKDAVDLIRYYLENWEERQKLEDKAKKKALEYTYTKQLDKLLKCVE